MASDDESLQLSAINLAHLIELVGEIMHTRVGKSDRPHASAACLMTYFIISAPRPLTGTELSQLIEQGSAALMPMVIDKLVENSEYVPPNIPSRES